MRRRNPRVPPPDPFDLWCEALSCSSPEWQAIMASFPGGPNDPVEPVALAWLAWPGRAAWLEAHPPWVPAPDEPFAPPGGHYGRGLDNSALKEWGL